MKQNKAQGLGEVNIIFEGTGIWTSWMRLRKNSILFISNPREKCLGAKRKCQNRPASKKTEQSFHSCVLLHGTDEEAGYIKYGTLPAKICRNQFPSSILPLTLSVIRASVSPSAN